MADYIVRIYRRKEENGGHFGVVEEVGTEGKKEFRDLAELVRLLRGDPPDERRRAERLRLFVPATVEGTDISGKPFSEEIVIEELNPHGAGFLMKARVLEGDELRLRIAPASGGLRKQARVVSIAQAPEP
ncbi:MAG TPA: hypothetical protein VLB08_04310, partial [Candidatus Deferrimicrobium sp.]|nr:hypothetical protein [Candidatus Deferrimicrobium sp.]